MARVADQFVERVRACIARHGLLPLERPEGPGGRPEPVLVATSGGPDSVALLVALAEIARSAVPFGPIVAHLNHGLRGPAADADQAFVEVLAADLGLRCETGRADVPAEAAAAGVGIEEAARDARRRFLTDAARRLGASKVALGHTRDDRVETVLFHVLRGTGVEGLASLGPRASLPSPGGGRGEETLEIVRPLIAVSRAEVVAFLKARGQTWRQDETNASPAHTRNRLRHELLPRLRDRYNPRLDEALERLSDQAAGASEVLADALEAAWRAVVREMPPTAATCNCAGVEAPAPGGIVIDADGFAALRPWLQGALVRRAVGHLGGGLKHMGADRTREAVKALLANGAAGPVDLPGGLAAARRRRAIRIERRQQDG